MNIVLIKSVKHFVYVYKFSNFNSINDRIAQKVSNILIIMSIIGKNIRKIRTVKKLSQASFAELFNLARPSVGAYEEERSEPKLETVIQIANYFGISIDSLLTKELTINDLFNFNVHFEENVKEITAKEKKLELDTNFIKSVLVPGDKQIEYIVHINNRDFVSTLPKILIPKYHDKSIRAFELTSDDMHDNFHGINRGDMVFGRKMSTPYDFVKGNLYVIINNERIIIRRAKPQSEFLILIPDNANFDSTEIKKGDIIEAWEVVGYFSQKITAPTLISERIMHLENQFDLLDRRLNKIENNGS